MSGVLTTPTYGVSERGERLIAEASHGKAEAYRAALVVPAGFLFVGFYCEHPLRQVDGEWTREPVHYERSYKNKSGRKRAKNTVSARSCANYDMDFGADGQPVCPQAQPMFIRDPEATS